MAYLSKEQIQKALQSGQVPQELNSCRKHDIRARFHTEPTLDASKLDYKQSFFDWVNTMLNKSKQQVFAHLLTLPIETVEFTEGVFDELTKVFEAQDRYIDFRFTNPALQQDFEGYLKSIGDNNFWQTKGFQAMKAAINSIVIVDLPAIKEGQQNPDRFPRPYYYFLDVQKIIAFDVDNLFKVEYIIFKDENNDKLAHAFDDGFYRTYLLDDNGGWKLILESAHDLGYTPARSFWTTPFEYCSKIQKRGPQSNSLGKFDWLLLLYTFTKHVELYAGFPIDVMYEQRCTYKDAQGNQCEGGFVTSTIADPSINGNAPRRVTTPCPTCKDKALLGPGTVLIAPAVASKDDPDLIQGMNRISADKDSLEYLLDRVAKYEESISVNMIGYVAEGIREAMNKEQVGSMLESQVNCLAEVRDNFENIHRFVLETLARLRYGSNAIVSITCNYGSKWFIHSVEKLQEQYKEAKNNGFANFELDAQFTQIILTKYKNNPGMLERSRTLRAIEPFQNYTVADLGTLSEKFGLNEDLIHLKIDFTSYVNRFEREFMNLGLFMQSMPFEVKVAFVQKKLLEYVKEDYPEEPKEADIVLDAPPAPGAPPQLPPAA